LIGAKVAVITGCAVLAALGYVLLKIERCWRELRRRSAFSLYLINSAKARKSRQFK
jgi:hypothetical protein